MESDARYIKNLEGVLSDYVEEELEVRKHKVNYRIHTTPEGIVTKIEIEKKIKGKNDVQINTA